MKASLAVGFVPAVRPVERQRVMISRHLVLAFSLTLLSGFFDAMAQSGDKSDHFDLVN
jgi:hypothetical protein